MSRSEQSMPNDPIQQSDPAGSRHEPLAVQNTYQQLTTLDEPIVFLGGNHGC